MRKNILRGLLTVLLGTTSVSMVNAQMPAQSASNVEAPGFSLGMNFGLSDLWGDVGTATVIDHYVNNKYWDLPHFTGGLFVRYSFHPFIAARLGVSYGTYYATDEWNVQQAKKASSLQSDYVQRYARRQDIKDNIWEGTLMFEISPLRTNYRSKMAHHKLQPILLAGIGYFHYTPYSTFTDPETKISQMVPIANLHLEGDGFKNMPNAPAAVSQWQICVPLGAGLKWDVGEHVTIGAEWVWRMTMTDYLDGVSGKYIDPANFKSNLSPTNAYIATYLSNRTWLEHVDIAKTGDTRGNSSNNDSYSSISVSVYYRFNTHTTNWWGGN